MHRQTISTIEIFARIFNKVLFTQKFFSIWNEMITDTLVGFRSSGIEEVDNRHLEHAHERRKETKIERAGVRKHAGIS